MKPEAITLYYRDGGSDKVYQAELKEQDGGCIVNFAFGRRGTTLQTGTKTASPVPYDKAKKIFDKLVGEKTAKGYSPGADGTPYTSTSNEERATGIYPQLLNPIAEDDVERYFADNDFWMQEKFDGKRILIQQDAQGNVRGINRKGLLVALPDNVHMAAQKLNGPFLFDGEAIGERVVIFDCLELGGACQRKQSYQHRWIRIPEFGKESSIQRAVVAVNLSEKKELFGKIKRKGGEGVVFKRHDAVYVAGRPASGGSQLKCKFYATASVVVASVNGSKRSVAVEVNDGSQPVRIGNVTIPPNEGIPEPKSVIEVRYLYAYKGGSLYQPTFIHQRDDVLPAECGIGQLKFKAEEDGDE